MRAPFLLAAFLSSALLFVVEPLAARLVLPTFGGAPAVWNGTLLFFQTALVLGYALAHLAATCLSPKTQRIVQPAFLLLSLLTIPLARDSGFQAWVRDRAAQGGAGVGLLLVALAGLVGLPFVALSINSPLLQRWYATTGAKDAARPTFLYAAGNLGSLLALLAYPLLIEPRLGLSGQAADWRIGLFALALLVGICALSGNRGSRVADRGDALPTETPTATQGIASEDPAIRDPRSAIQRRLLWLALAAVPSALLMGCTTYITSNVAPIPLLWVVPLALYLLTFVLVYAARPLAPVALLGRVLPMLLVPLAITILLAADKPAMGLFHLAVFFVATWMCHGRLAQEAPPAEGLTEYWLYVSLGGALGGVFVAVVAPLVFNSLAEYPFALVAAAMLRPAIPRKTVDDNSRLSPTTSRLTDLAAMLIFGPWALMVALFRLSKPRAVAKPSSFQAIWDDRRIDLIYPLLLACLGVILILVGKPLLPPGTARTFLLMGVPAALAFAAIDRPLRFGFALGVAIWVPTALQVASDGTVLLTERSFFGVHRVVREAAVQASLWTPGKRGGTTRNVEYGPFMELLHGNTVHGKQDRAHPGDALTYYHRTGPIGSIMSRYRPARVALVGLGVGSLAAYGVPGQRLDVFEIDPVVTRIAEDPRLFTFLHDSRADVKVTLGDARLTLSRAEPGYGLIVLDAFSSDSIPIHLLTVESLRMAMSKLAPGGVLAIHVSNRYLDLEPVLAANAQALGVAAQSDMDVASPDEKLAGKTESHWIAMGRRMADLKPVLSGDWGQLDDRPGLRPWTDDYSNVLGVFNADQ